MVIKGANWALAVCARTSFNCVYINIKFAVMQIEKSFHLFIVAFDKMMYSIMI